MGYFSNGSEGDDYRERYCVRCVNFRPNAGGAGSEGCAIFDLHLLYNYDQCDDTERGKAIKELLDGLIPVSADKMYNARCEMFLAKED